MLEQQDYIFAASKTLGQLGALTWRFALKFWYLVLAIAALLAASILFVVEDPNSSAHVAAGLGGLLASLGLTWKGIGGSLGKAASKLERPVWEAALDMQIAEAMTLTPVSKVGKSYSPPELRR